MSPLHGAAGRGCRTSCSLRDSPAWRLGRCHDSGPPVAPPTGPADPHLHADRMTGSDLTVASVAISAFVNGSRHGQRRAQHISEVAMAVDTAVVFGASYDTEDDAVADYEAVKDLYVQSGLIDTYDAAVVTRHTDGKVKIVKKHEQPTRQG